MTTNLTPNLTLVPNTPTRTRYKGVEADIVRMFRESAQAGQYEKRIPHKPEDRVQYERSTGTGRADIIIFHRKDRSATVIEVKDGTNGYRHVVAGIGQAAFYAAQLDMAVSRVRQALLWTSIGSIDQDAMIELACRRSHTVALPWPHLSILLAADALVYAMRRCAPQEV